ncbi:CDP-glycerol glycerophosphotransferase family protein, partial [Streptomyces sp. GC420]|uniref:CDP-glycerol glycerophosphotransferase family protein n=1 Tax=Streptomyces sp. GC420 TaxID=2697568 RepID=UPI001AA19D0F
RAGRARRPGPPGSSGPSGTPGTPGSSGCLDLFEQYDRVFALVGSRPEWARLRPVLFRRAVDDVAALLTARGRVPAAERAAFARRAAELCRRHGSARDVPRRPAARLRHALLRLGSHRAHRGLSLAARVLRRSWRVTARALRGLRRALLRIHYGVQLLLPLRRNHAVFTSSGPGRGYCGDPAAVEAAVRELAPRIRTAWIAEPAGLHTVPPATRRLRPGTAAYWTALARSAYVVTETGLGLRPVRRRGRTVVRTGTGTPLKRVGLDLRDRPAAVRETTVRDRTARNTDLARLPAAADGWDYVLSGNRHSTVVLQRAFPGGYTTLEHGRPRNDRLLNATARDVARIRENLGIPPGSTAVLYAPTPVSIPLSEKKKKEKS